MSEVTRILSAIEHGDARAAEQLLPLVYDELRQLAAQKLAQEKPGQTLQATALVHEVYLRLVDVDKAQQWNSRGHFFAAAAEAMRRILVDQARRKQADKRGGGRRVPLDGVDAACLPPPPDLLDIDDAFARILLQADFFCVPPDKETGKSALQVKHLEDVGHASRPQKSPGVVSARRRQTAARAVGRLCRPGLRRRRGAGGAGQTPPPGPW